MIDAMKAKLSILVGLAVTMLSLASAWAWHAKGHEKATELAVASLGDDVPQFLRSGTAAMVACVNDPDLFTKPTGAPQLHSSEAPEHFFDIELLDGATLPPTRAEFVQLCQKKNLQSSKVGLLPYALLEWTQRLTVALAEYRQRPGDKNLQAKCLVYAGLLAHYAQDSCQPLHTTIHYDGRAKDDRSSPHSGIHGRVDATMGKLRVEVAPAATRLKPAAMDDLWQGIIKAIDASHAQVDRVYELEAQWPAMEDDLPGDSKVAEFVRERLDAAATLTASLIETAWRDSAKVQWPQWYLDEHAERSSQTKPAPATRPAAAPK